MLVQDNTAFVSKLIEILFEAIYQYESRSKKFILCIEIYLKSQSFTNRLSSTPDSTSCLVNIFFGIS